MSNAPQTRWTPQAVFGILCFLGAIVVYTLYADAPNPSELDPLALQNALHDSQQAGKLALALAVFGGSLLGWSPSLPGLPKLSGDDNDGGRRADEPQRPDDKPPKPQTRTALIVGALLAALSLALPACATLGERRVDRLEWEVLDGDRGPASCRVRLLGDGSELGRWSASFCPDALLRTGPR